MQFRDWSKHKEKYLGKPKLPKYLKKDANFLLVLTNQNCKLKGDKIHFPKAFQGFTISPKFIEKDNFDSFQQVRMIPHKNKIVVELVYCIKVPEQKPDNQKYIGIDIGVNNLATVCNNMGQQAFIINGRPLKSINQFYNRQISHYREICKRMNNRDYSQRMARLTEKRDAKISDYVHKASRCMPAFAAYKKVEFSSSNEKVLSLSNIKKDSSNTCKETLYIFSKHYSKCVSFFCKVKVRKKGETKKLVYKTMTRL